MCKHKVGDVIWGVVVLSERQGTKQRPVIIIDVNTTDCRYLVVHCYSLLEKHTKQKGIEVMTGSTIFTECGFQNDTFVSCGCKSWIPERLLLRNPANDRKPMGFCSFISELKSCVEQSKKY